VRLRVPLRLAITVFAAAVALTACNAPTSPSAVTPRTPSSLLRATDDALRDRRIVGVFDGDSITSIGDPYDVAEHFHFVVRDAAGDSVGFTKVRKVISFTFIETVGGPIPPGSEICTVPPPGALVLYCPATDFPGPNSPGAFAGYWLVTVQGDHIPGVPRVDVRGTFHLYIRSSPNSPLSMAASFDGDSVVRDDKRYDVARHFFFRVVNQYGDSVTSVPVINLPSVQWVLVSGTAPPPSPPICSPTLDVIVLQCEPSSGDGFVGYYSVTVQEASFGDISNPAFRGRFDLYVDRAVQARHH
jgi:hypothetical protein